MELRVRRCEVKVTGDGRELRVVKDWMMMMRRRRSEELGSLEGWKIPVGWTNRRIIWKL